jgi:hypothetical protein
LAADGCPGLRLGLNEVSSRFEGRRLKRPPRLCVKALALKEICKASLIYAESLFRMYLGVKIPKSTPHYWEVRHGDAVEDALKALNLLRNRPAGAREAGLNIPSVHSVRMMMSEAELRALERVEALGSHLSLIDLIQGGGEAPSLPARVNGTSKTCA